MTKVYARRVIGRPAAELYDFVADMRNEALWWKGVKRVEVVEEGVRYILHARFLFFPANAYVTVIERVRPQRFVIKATGRFAYTCEYLFDDNALTLRFEVEGWPQWASPLFKMVTNYNLRRLERVFAH